MTNLLIILAEFLLVVLMIGVASFWVLWLLQLGGVLRLPDASDLPGPETSDMMIGNPILPRDLSDEQLDRLASLCGITIVDPAEPGSRLDNVGLPGLARREGDHNHPTKGGVA